MSKPLPSTTVFVDDVLQRVPHTAEFPLRVTVELTNHCNLACAMCPRRYMKGPKGYLSPDLFRRIADQLSERSGTALVPFFRGEPLLHPRCVALLAYATNKGIGPIQLATNATLLTPEISRALLDLAIDFISFSVDSLDPETYRAVRKGSDLRGVIRNIEEFCEAREKAGSHRPEIQVSVVRTEDTAPEVEAFVAFWRPRVDRVRVYEEHSQGGAFGALGDHPRPDNQAERRPCFKPFEDMVIYWDGGVALCNHDWDRTEALGDARNESLHGIWHGRAYERIRQAHLHRPGSLESPCAECDHWESFYSQGGYIGELYEKA